MNPLQNPLLRQPPAPSAPPLPATDPTTPQETLLGLASDPCQLPLVLRNPNTPTSLLFKRWPDHPDAFLENPLFSLWRLQGHLDDLGDEYNGWHRPGLDVLKWPLEQYRMLCTAVVLHLCRTGDEDRLEALAPDRASWLEMYLLKPDQRTVMAKDPCGKVRRKLAKTIADGFGKHPRPSAELLALLLRDPSPEVAAPLAEVVPGEAEQTIALERGFSLEQGYPILQELARNPHLHPRVLRELVLRCEALDKPDKLMAELREGRTEDRNRDRHILAIALGPDSTAFRKPDPELHQDMFQELARRKPDLLPLLALHPAVQGPLRAELMAHPDPAIHLEALERAQFLYRRSKEHEGKPCPNMFLAASARVDDQAATGAHVALAACTSLPLTLAQRLIDLEHSTQAHQTLAATHSLPLDMVQQLFDKGEHVQRALVHEDTRKEVLQLVVAQASPDVLVDRMCWVAHVHRLKLVLREHPDVQVRMALARALGDHRRDSGGTRELLAVDPDKRVRIALLSNLSRTRIGEQAARDLLCNDPDPSVRFMAAWRRMLSQEKRDAMLRDERPGLRFAALRCTSPSDAELRRLLEDPYPRIRRMAADEMAGRDSIFSHRTTGIQHVTAYRIRGHSRTWELNWSLASTDGHVPVRRIAAEVHDLPLPVLERLLNDPDAEVRERLLARPVWATRNAAVQRHLRLRLPSLRALDRCTPYVRALFATFSSTPATTQERLAGDRHWYVRARLAYNATVSDALLDRLAQDPDPLVAAAANRAKGRRPARPTNTNTNN
jgi:hypothetical protein